MATPKVKFKEVNIKAVKPYDNNPRENSGAVKSTNAVVQRAIDVIENTTGGVLFKCSACGATGDPYDGFCRKCGYLLPKDKMLWRANELMERELRNKNPHGIKGLAYIKGVGRIDLEVGKKGVGPGRDNGYGLVKLLQKHKEELPHLGMTLVLGKTYNPKEEDRIIRVLGDRIAAIAKKGSRGSILTHYKEARKAASTEAAR